VDSLQAEVETLRLDVARLWSIVTGGMGGDDGGGFPPR
jgi:hypothetical protein